MGIEQNANRLSRALGTQLSGKIQCQILGREMCYICTWQSSEPGFRAQAYPATWGATARRGIGTNLLRGVELLIGRYRNLAPLMAAKSEMPTLPNL
jgi:hypothetical protein